jgi:DNA-binding transcriptional LysR family regulator
MENLEDIVVFTRVVEKGSFTAAGKELQMSTSAVSKHISRLESALSLKLLYRSTHDLFLTESGTAFYDHCVKIIGELEQARATAAALSDGVKGTLRVHATPGVAQRIVAPATIDFMAMYSGVSVELIATDVTPALMRHAVDVMISSRDLVKETSLNSGLVSRDLGAVPYVICASPKYLSQLGVPETPHELSKHNCLIHLTQKNASDWEFSGANGSSYSVCVTGSFRSNLESAVLRAAAAGAGIARLPEYTARREISAGGLQSIFQSNVTSDRVIKAFFPKSKYLPTKVRAFLDFLQKRMREMPALR